MIRFWFILESSFDAISSFSLHSRLMFNLFINSIFSSILINIINYVFYILALIPKYTFSVLRFYNVTILIPYVFLINRLYTELISPLSLLFSFQLLLDYSVHYIIDIFLLIILNNYLITSLYLIFNCFYIIFN